MRIFLAILLLSSTMPALAQFSEQNGKKDMVEVKEVDLLEAILSEGVASRR
jgi:hypothetical protein